MEYIGLEGERHIRIRREDLLKVVELLVDAHFTITIPRNRVGQLISLQDIGAQKKAYRLLRVA